MASPRNPPNPGNPPQTLTVQYDGVTDLDGVTPSVAFSRDPTSPDYIEPDASGIYHVPQNGPLGLVDPDLGVGGSMGDRWISWLELAPEVASTISVATVDGEEPTLQLAAIEPAQLVASVLFRNTRFRCPQGGLIRLGGTAGAATKVRLRISLEPETCCDPDAEATPTVVVDQLQQLIYSGADLTAVEDDPLFVSWADADMSGGTALKHRLNTDRAVRFVGFSVLQVNGQFNPFVGNLEIYDNGVLVQTVPLEVPYNTPAAFSFSPAVEIAALRSITCAFVPSAGLTTLSLSGAFQVHWL